MAAPIYQPQIEEDFLARVTDIAYRALLEQGLARPFVEVELALWAQIRTAYRAAQPAIEEVR